MQLTFVGRWISSVRLIALPFVVGAIALAVYPLGRWETWAWVTTFAVLMALIAGWLVHRLSEERAKAEARAEEAERLHEAERQNRRGASAHLAAARRLRRARLPRGANAARRRDRGLYIARAIAEAHGGTLDVVSEPGAGATFRLDLPSR